jgi:hypothetical protein
MNPTKGFHPLISMYDFSREKLERDRVYHRARTVSEVSTIDSQDAANVAAANLVTPVDDASLRQQQFNLTLLSPRALPLPHKKDNLLPSATAKADYSILHCLGLQFRKRYISLGCRMITLLLLRLRLLPWDLNAIIYLAVLLQVRIAEVIA